MTDCPPFSLKEEEPHKAVKKENEERKVWMDPEISPGCSFSVTLDGKPVNAGGKVGDFQLIGLRGNGEASFRAIRDNPQGGWVHFYVSCAECGPTRSTNGIFLATGLPVNYKATQVVKTAGLPLTLPLFLLFGANWLGCKLICLFWKAPAGQVCECTSAREALGAVLDILPDWLKAPFK